VTLRAVFFDVGEARAFHLRRGPRGRLQATPQGAIAIDSLREVPAHLGAMSAVGP
jgi:hypothetical protein